MATKHLINASFTPSKCCTTKLSLRQQLGVAHLLEGSVQRNERKVRVNAQLIDARTDAHLWAETYDRDLADVFAIQSDIARGIVSQLQARLAPEEKNRLETKPTSNPDAYLLYLQANELGHVAASREEAVEVEKLYARAIALDPDFVLARTRASMWNSLMYSIGRDPERKERARNMAEEALRRAPELGEAHFALGLCFYRIDRDYPAALKELAIARASSPNNAEILEATGFIYRRQNRWTEALAAFAETLERDPRRAHFDGVADTLRTMRQWSKAGEAYHRGLQLEPGLSDGWVGLAYVQFAQSGNPTAAHATLDRLSEAMKRKPAVQGARWEYAMLARDFSAAAQLIPDRPIDEYPAFEPAGYFKACLALAQGDRERARSVLEEIQPIYEAGARDHPDDPTFHAPLGRFYALLGQKENAIREGLKAVELCPESKDAVAGPLYATSLAFIYAQTGEVEEAVTLLAHLLTIPAAENITAAHLRLSWEWDPLRNDPRFQKLVAGSEARGLNP